MKLRLPEPTGAHANSHTHTHTHTHICRITVAAVWQLWSSLWALPWKQENCIRGTKTDTQKHTFPARRGRESSDPLRLLKSRRVLLRRADFTGRGVLHALLKCDGGVLTSELLRGFSLTDEDTKFEINFRNHHVSFTLLSPHLFRKTASNCGQNVEGNLPCMKRESIQQQKTASGCFWRRIMQFPWKQGKANVTTAAEKLWVCFCFFFFLPVICLLERQPWTTKPTGSQLEWRWGQRSQLADWQTEEPPTSLAGNVSLSWPWRSEDGVPWGGVDRQDDVWPLFSNTNRHVTGTITQQLDAIKWSVWTYIHKTERRLQDCDYCM